jgi:acyl dehydratase
MVMTWDTVPIGAETGRVELVVTDAMIDDYLASMELDLAWFNRAASPYGTRIAPPDMVPKLCMDKLFQDYIHREIGPNIRAKQAFSFYAPIPVGSTVRAVGHLVEKYERRGRRFMTFEALFTDAQGRKLVLDRRTQLVLGENFNIEKK